MFYHIRRCQNIFNYASFMDVSFKFVSQSFHNLKSKHEFGYVEQDWRPSIWVVTFPHGRGWTLSPSPSHTHTHTHSLLSLSHKHTVCRLLHFSFSLLFFWGNFLNNNPGPKFSHKLREKYFCKFFSTNKVKIKFVHYAAAPIKKKSLWFIVTGLFKRF